LRVGEGGAGDGVGPPDTEECRVGGRKGAHAYNVAAGNGTVGHVFGDPEGAGPGDVVQGFEPGEHA
jgi:hypothetical protein